MSKFWLVWNPMGRTPHHKHATPEDARKEAERLARTQDGEFFVLEAVSVSKRVSVETVPLGPAPPPMRTPWICAYCGERVTPEARPHECPKPAAGGDE